MKKLIVLLAILFSIKGFSQDSCTTWTTKDSVDRFYDTVHATLIKCGAGVDGFVVAIHEFYMTISIPDKQEIEIDGTTFHYSPRIKFTSTDLKYKYFVKEKNQLKEIKDIDDFNIVRW